MSEITLQQTKDALVEIIQSNPTTTNPTDGVTGCLYNGVDQDGVPDGTHCIAAAVLLKLTGQTVPAEYEGLGVPDEEIVQFSSFTADARHFLTSAQTTADGNGDGPRPWGIVGQKLGLDV